MPPAPTKMDEKKQLALAELKADWNKQCVIADLAIDNQDDDMLTEAMQKIHDLEETMRCVEKQS